MLGGRHRSSYIPPACLPGLWELRRTYECLKNRRGSLEVGDSHARLLQVVIAGQRTHDYGVATGVGKATEQCDYRQPQSLFHWIPLSGQQLTLDRKDNKN